jgi:hypothetical protein
LADEVAALRSRSWYRLAWARFAGWPAARPGSNPTDFVRRPVLAGDGPFFQRGFLLGDAAEIAGSAVRRAKRAPSGTLIFGPYVNLPAGTYAVTFDARLYRYARIDQFQADVVCADAQATSDRAGVGFTRWRRGV